MPPELPEPALVALVGPSGSGKSTWAAERFRRAEVVSSDALRAVVGSGPADLDASDDAFRLLDSIVAARLGRRLTTVVDTLGTDVERRRAHIAEARRHGLFCVAVVFDDPVQLTRERNARRDRPVPAMVLTVQHRRHASARDELAGEGWDAVHVIRSQARGAHRPDDDRLSPTPDAASAVPGAASPTAPSPAGKLPEIVVHLSAFPWGEDPLGWLTAMAGAAEETGFAGLSLMDHLVQIPQVGRAWDPIPEPWVALGALAAAGTQLRLGTLVSPVTFRPAGVTAKAAATLDVLCGGRSFLGLGAGWWEREHAGFGLDLTPPHERLDRLEASIETVRALWAAGTKPFVGEWVSLPETTCYPRPTGTPPIVVGGSGARSLSIAGRLGDACNIPSTEADLPARIEAVRTAAAAVGRDPADVAVTVLDLPLVGRDRDDVWTRVERHRGRTAAATWAARHHAGTSDAHRERYARLLDLGVTTVFVAPVGLAGPDDVYALAPLVT
ncbi:MAG: LLM class flavin-dependent oxidoreductase [Dermatophilaceae bacterium]